MTFSIIARDADGALGMAVSSSSPAVAARCLHLRGGVGVVASQNITDPRFGPYLLDLLADGLSPAEAVTRLQADDDTLDYRQISVLAPSGAGTAHSGRYTLGTYASSVGADAVVAGNMLAATSVPDAMLAEFGDTGGELETRLLAAMQAGLGAGERPGRCIPLASPSFAAPDGQRPICAWTGRRIRSAIWKCYWRPGCHSVTTTSPVAKTQHHLLLRGARR